MKSTYFICMFALLDLSTLLCMKKSDEMAPVTVQSQIINYMHKPGDGHKILAEARLMRTVSEKLLGIRQDADDLDFMAFSKMKKTTTSEKTKATITDSATEEETESSGSSSSETRIRAEKMRRNTLPT